MEQCTKDGYSERKRQVMTFSDYIDAYKKSNNGCSLYLKDWHFFRYVTERCRVNLASWDCLIIFKLIALNTLSVSY